MRFIKTNLPILIEYADDKTDSKYIRAKKNLDSQLFDYREAKKQLDVLLFDKEGALSYTTEFAHPNSDLGKKLPLNAHNAVIQGRNKIFVSEVFESDFTKSGFEILVTAPIRNFDNEFIGIVAMAIDMGPVYDSIQDLTGLGETLIGGFRTADERHMGINQDHVMYLNPLRHDTIESLEKYVLIGSTEAIPIQEASQGNNGTGISIDYRGEETLATWRHIPSFNWGLVAKVDTKEAFASTLVLRNQVIAILTIFTLVVFVVFVFLVQSIVRRNIAEEKIKELNDLLRLLNKILRHDILNDLTVVKGNISIYLQYGSKKVDVEQTMKEAEKAIERDISFIGQMKELEEAVSMGDDLSLVNIKKLTKNASEQFKNIKITIRGEAFVYADKALESVITNLLRNADVHGKANHIDIKIADNGKEVIVSVADNGKGIPDEIKSKLFVEGFKYGITGHSGLGLYIVRKTIERYKGSVHVEDNKPKGTIFILKLPVVRKK